MSTHEPNDESATTYRQVDLSGEVINDYSEHNRSRQRSEPSTDSVDVTAMLDRLGSPRRDNHTNPANAVEKVRAWCVRRGFPLSEFRIYEHPEYGTVQIEKTGYVEADEWERIRSLFHETEGIGFDGDVNFCRPEWVASLPASDLTVSPGDETATVDRPRESPDDTDRFPCPVSGCGEGFADVDALAGHIGGKAPHDEAHDDYGEVVRDELLELEVRS